MRVRSVVCVHHVEASRFGLDSGHPASVVQLLDLRGGGAGDGVRVVVCTDTICFGERGFVRYVFFLEFRGRRAFLQSKGDHL